MEVRDFRLWWVATMAMNVSLQMIDVAIGWQVYAQHRSPLDLGWIGLAEFMPVLILALPAGHLADRVPRRTIFAAALVLEASVGAGLAAISGVGVTNVIPYLGLALSSGTAMALVNPASTAMPPTLVPPALLASALTLRNIAGRVAMVAGPALGGLLFGISAAFVYGMAAATCLAASVCVLTIRRQPAASLAAGAHQSSPGLRSVLEGLRFVRRTPVLLGAILLDLLGVLFGGAVALLPVFARSILHVGPTGVGILRAAPAVGALLAAAVIMRRPIGRSAGRTLLLVVALFGLSVVVFGLSRSYPLSLLALAVGGFVDLFSMNIRAMISALATPDRLRGRVGAVENVFISGSNELGAFESGLAASLVGTVPAVVGGGALTILIAVTWRWVFPSLAHVDQLRDIEAEPAPIYA